MFKSILLILSIAIGSTLAQPANQNVSKLVINESNKDVRAFERIVIQPNMTGIFNSSSPKNFRIIKSNVTSQHKLPVNLVYETENSFYLVTSVAHPSKLNVNFNFKVSPKKVLTSSYHYLVKKSEHNFTNPIEMVFKNINLTQFLAKETELINYFNEVLSNNVVVLSVENRGNNLGVTLGNSEPDVSFKTKTLFKSTCPSADTNDLTVKTGLELVPCSFKIVGKPLHETANYDSNELDLDLDLLMNGSLMMNLSYSLMVFVVILQVWWFS